MMKHGKSIARKRMNHVISEIDNAIILAGGREIRLRLCKEEEGLRLFVHGDFHPDKRADMVEMSKLLRPNVRDLALVETYGELTGDDQYTSDSELTLVGHMLDKAEVTVGAGEVDMELYLAF